MNGYAKTKVLFKFSILGRLYVEMRPKKLIKINCHLTVWGAKCDNMPMINVVIFPLDRISDIANLISETSDIISDLQYHIRVFLLYLRQSIAISGGSNLISGVPLPLSSSCPL